MSETTTTTTKAYTQPQIESTEWPGHSGESYTYYVYEWPTAFRSVPGNYVFCKLVNSEWVPVHVGETEDLANLFDDHPAMACLKKNGATHIHARANKAGEQARLAEEADIRRNFEAPCNK